MKVSYNWLNKYVSLENVSPLQLADKLTTAGLEVEGIETLASATNLVIGKVLTCTNHPDSDHLNVCTVDVEKEILQIVCGAPNVGVGLKVIVACVGAKLPKMEIKQSSVRGVESNGMLCSLNELGVDETLLSQQQMDGIEILNDDAIVGNEQVLKYLGLDDAILDVSQTPNRADFMAMYSVAKEVGAILNREVKLPNSKDSMDFGIETQLVVNSNSIKCPYIMGKIIGSVKVGKSPKWMSDHLNAAGIKSINNVVDISNYVMLETGQPLHFYDLNKMAKKEICVSDNLNVEFCALDGVSYQINENDLVITSNNLPIGIAGIMGGDDSKISDETTGIIIESANFNQVSIRNSARKFGLNTEASSRFTKGLDPLAQTKAMDRAVELLVEYAKATLIEKTVTFGSVEFTPISVNETLSHANQLLGCDFSMDEVVDILQRLDFNPVVNKDVITCTIPSYRTDILIAEDIDEEIIRLLGYDRLVSTLPMMVATVGELTPKQKMRRSIKNALCSMSLSEAITYTLVSDKFVAQGVNQMHETVVLASPMSDQRKNIRGSIMPSLLECLAYNQARKNDNVNLFEISNVYGTNIVHERLGIILSGALMSSKLNNVNIATDFYALKGIFEQCIKQLGFANSRLTYQKNTIDTTNFHPHKSACVYLGKQLVAILGEVHPTACKSNDISKCFYAEVFLDVLFDAKASKVKFKAVNKYPSVKRDVALVCAEQLCVSELINTITKTNRNLVSDVEVFDVYVGDKVEQGYKSIALSIIYQAGHTLTETEILETHNSILVNLEKKCNAILRK